MDVVVVQPQIPDAVLDKASATAENVRFVGLHDLAHEALWHLILGLLELLLDRSPEVRHARRPRPRPLATLLWAIDMLMIMIANRHFHGRKKLVKSDAPDICFDFEFDRKSHGDN